jgi:2-keto-4-pentenoate hydratase
MSAGPNGPWSPIGATADLAAELGAARRGGYTIPSRRGSEEALSLEAACELGRNLERERVSAGWRPAGWKLGFTNQALWGRLGLDSPIRARIYRETICAASLASGELVQPRIEPEVVLGIGADLAQEADADAAAAAVEWAAAGLEVVQCHFEGWVMTPAEAVADAGVHAALAIGPPTEVDAAAVRGLATARCELLRDGLFVASGRGANVLGGPLDALHWLVRGLPGGLRTGEIVTTGTLTEALPLEPGERWQHRLTAAIVLEPVALEIR